MAVIEWKMAINLAPEWGAMEEAVRKDDKIELWSAVATLVMKLHDMKNTINKECGYGVGEELDEHLRIAEEAFEDVEAFDAWLTQLVEFCTEHQILLGIEE